MFSGIVEELGEIERLSRRGGIVLIEIKAEKTLKDTKVGDSISVNGTCLTVVNNEHGILSFEASPQTLKATNLGGLRVCDRVNLERSLKVGDRLSGHFVTGHVDCLGIIRKKSYVQGNLCYEIAVPTQFFKYCIPKGSISVDGISLTIVDRKSNSFTIYIIPHTYKNTTLKFKGSSDRVNIEFDVLTKR